MSDAARLLIALLCSACGMAWLALAMKVHWQQARGSLALSPAMAVLLRTLGAVSLLASLVLCLSADHGSIAVLVWIMSLAAAALTVAFALSWRPRWLAWLVPWVRRAG